MPEEQISIADLNNKLMGVTLSVKARSPKEPMPEHPNPAKMEQGDFFFVDYVGKCMGTDKEDGRDFLLIETVVGAREKIAVYLDSIEDISMYQPPSPKVFPVAGLSKNPGHSKS